MKKSYIYTVKIRDEENTKKTEFKKGLGVGVLYEVEVSFKVKKEELESNAFTQAKYNMGQKIMDKILTVEWKEK